MSDLSQFFTWAFAGPKEVKPVLTVDLASDIPTEKFIRALKDAGLTIAEQPGTKRLIIRQAGEMDNRPIRKKTREAARGAN